MPLACAAAPEQTPRTCLDAYQQELDYIIATLRRLGAPRADLEDLAQDLFIELRSSWDRYDPTRPLRPYLYCIALRLIAAHRRKRNRDVVTDAIDPVDSTAIADEVLHARRLRNVCTAALQEVPLLRRAVLIMHDIDGVSVADIERDLSVPRFTLYSRLRRGRQEFGRAVRRMLRLQNT